jgi:hypothetical protein
MQRAEIDEANELIFQMQGEQELVDSVLQSEFPLRRQFLARARTVEVSSASLCTLGQHDEGCVIL